MEHDIEERIRAAELEIREIKTRLTKKHESIDEMHSEINRLTECINSVVALTETVNKTQKDMHEDLRNSQLKLEELSKEVITHTVQFESYKERQKGNQWQISSVLAVISIIVAVGINVFL